MESPGASASQRSSDNGKATHIFTELRSHDDLLLPVRGSKRLKYTCITCSRQYIALGSSHGGLYIFQRDTLKYLQQIGNKEGLTKALFSPNENVIGMATSGGAVIAWKLNITSRQKAERLVAAQAHRNHRITSLCWDGAGLRLFSGDERGRITVTNTDSSKPSGIFKFQSELVVDVDSSVVQMDFAEERLLISTMTRCYMCDPKKQLSFPIGTKLRDGAYGACFLNKSGSERPSIFCARPGSRMWEANTLCQVLNTHQFKQLLATPPLPVVGKGREATFPSEDTKHPPQSLAFPILHPLGNHFLVTWTERGVFVFDPVNVNVVFWTSDISGLVDVSVSKSSLYCLHQDGHVHKYTLQNIARCAASLYQQSLLVQCSRLVLRFQTQFQRSRARHHMPSRVLHELAKRVAAEDSLLGCDVEELAVAVENRMLDVASTVSSRRSSFDSYDEMRQQSGIYVVRKRLDSECSDDLPLGYDAHMDQIQGNMELTEKTSHDTIQETSPTKAETDSKEATPTEHISLEEKPVEHPEEDCSSLPNSSPSSNISTLDDSNTSSSSLDKLKDMSQLSEQSTPSASSSSENLEIVIEDDLEVAEGDAQFPDAETELIQAVTGSQYVQRQTEFTRDRSQSLEKLNEESSGGKSPSATTKRKKTKSRVIDITATVSRKPSPLQAMTPGSVLYRPTSLPDLSPQSSSQPRSLQRTPSSTTPSPALSPKKEARKQFPVSSALPSSNLIMAATSGLPHSSGLIETQQILLNSTTQINLKSVKDSLTSKLSKTKTFLQSIGDSNPLSPKDGEHSFPPMQRRPSPASSPISGSPTHRKGTSPSVPRREIPHQQSTGSPHPSPVTSPLHRPRPPGERDFPHGLEEETEEEQIDARHSEDLIEATKSAVPALHDRQTRYNTNALRDVLQPWVQKLEQSYRWCHSEGIIPWSKGHHLPVTVREDVGRLATLCFSLDIYANEEGHGNGEGEMEQETRSKIETGGDDCSDTSKLDGCRAAFIKRHFNILDRQRIIEVLRHKQSCHALRSLVQCEGDAAKNTEISDALDNADVPEAFDLLLRADLSSSNLPLYLCFLQRLCGLDSGRALDMIISDYPSIGPWHAFHILQDQTQSKCLILDYVESFLLTHPFAQRKKFIEQVMAMKPLVLSLAEAAVTFDPPISSDLFCDCGKLPNLGSHLIKWSHDQILDLILTSSSAPVDVLLPLFSRVGYWHGVVVLMGRKRDGKMDALKICIQLGDAALIDDDLIPSTEGDWRTVLEWMKICQPSIKGENDSSGRRCLNCGAVLSPCAARMSMTSEVTSDVVIEVGKQEIEETEDELSPSSQPECDWSIMEPSQPNDQSESLTEKVEHSTVIDRSDGFVGGRENGETRNSQSNSLLEASNNQKKVTSQSEEGIEEMSTPKQNGIEKPSPFSSHSTSSDSDWSPSVTWQRIALLSVSRLGALEGVRLLREVQVPEGFLSREFHQMCIYVNVWEKRQSLLSHAMLEGTDTYLWSKRQPLLGPVLQHTIMKEYQGCGDNGSEGERVHKVQKLLGQGQLYIEDPGTHWGRTTNLGR
eukprot:XP_011675904.1 PREDICTED: uncharacterized protein LOC100890358 [Strongylocentrotus purpuratus]